MVKKKKKKKALSKKKTTSSTKKSTRKSKKVGKKVTKGKGLTTSQKKSAPAKEAVQPAELNLKIATNEDIIKGAMEKAGKMTRKDLLDHFEKTLKVYMEEYDQTAQTKNAAMALAETQNETITRLKRETFDLGKGLEAEKRRTADLEVQCEVFQAKIEHWKTVAADAKDDHVHLLAAVEVKTRNENRYKDAKVRELGAQIKKEEARIQKVLGIPDEFLRPARKGKDPARYGSGKPSESGEHATQCGTGTMQ